MDIRYQVFVSSTFSDLENERAEVIRTLLNMDCIPSGMELFPAVDEEQFEYIKRVIDDCDYYLLIIAGRYGTLSPNGLSYTELEYQYAVDKGIKVIALVHKNPDLIPSGKIENNSESKQKLKSFKEEVTSNRLVRFWEKSEELPGRVALSVQAAIKMHPSIGWVRSNRVSSEQTQERLLELEQENLRLREEIQKYNLEPPIDSKLLAKGDELYEVLYSYELAFKDESTKTTISDSFKVSWDEIFSSMVQMLIQATNNQSLKKALSSYLFPKIITSIKEQHGEGVTTSTVVVEDESMSMILLQLRALGLITFDGARWRLTQAGEKKMIEIKIIKTSKQN